MIKHDRMLGGDMDDISKRIETFEFKSSRILLDEWRGSSVIEDVLNIR